MSDLKTTLGALLALAVSTASTASAQIRVESFRIEDGPGIQQFQFGRWFTADRDWVIPSTVECGVDCSQRMVRLYRRTVNGWEFAQRLLGPPGADFFGFLPNMGGRWLLNPAVESSLPSQRLGDVFVYELQGASWVDRGVISDTTARQRFANVFAIHGDAALLTADYDTTVPGRNPSYIFRRQGSTWVQEDVFRPAWIPGVTQERESRGKALLDDVAFVFQSGFNPGVAGSVHSIHVYDRQPNGRWTETGFLPNPVPLTFSRHYGATGLAAWADWLAVADSTWDGGAPGVVYMYQRTGNGPAGYELRQHLRPSNTSSGDYFGIHIDARDGRFLIGASRARSGPGTQRTGAAYFYDLDPATNLWDETEQLINTDIAAGTVVTAGPTRFGSWVGLTDDYAFVSDRYSQHTQTGLLAGAVFVYEFEVGTLACAGEPGPSGVAATLTATGSRSAGVGVVDFTGRGYEPGGLALLLASRTQGSVLYPVGSVGRLCLGGQVVRVAASVAAADPSGAWAFALALNEDPSALDVPIGSGETWSFQTWFRQAAGVSNFSDALEIDFR